MSQARAALGAAARRLRRRPGTPATVLAVLAVSLGAVTAIYSLLETVALRPLPYPDAERLDRIGATVPGQLELQEISWPKFEALAAAGAGRLAVAASYRASFALTDGESPEEVGGARISRDFLAVFGVSPVVGRGFNDGESRLGGADVALLSEPFWRSRFGADPSVVGRTLSVDGRPTTLVGVLPAELALAFRDVALWLPRPQEIRFMPAAVQARGAGYLQVVARRAPEVSPEAAQSLLDRVDERYAAERPGQYDGGYRLRAVDLDAHLLGESRVTLGAMLGGVILLLVVAAVDVAGLLWLDGMARRREMALRLALGGSPRRLAAEAAAEAALVAAGGGALGLAFAAGALELLKARGPADLPRLEQATLSPASLVVTFGTLAAVAVAALIAPAVRATRCDPREALAEASRGTSAGRASVRAQRALAAAQIALALVLLSSAGLFVRSLRQVEQLALGFEPEGLELAGLTLPPARYPDLETRRARFAEIVERVRGLSGVAAAALAEYPPTFGAPHTRLDVAGRAPTPPEEQIVVQRLIVSPGFVATSGVRLLAGRDFAPNPAVGAPPTALVSRSLSERLFGGSSPLGARLVIRGSDTPHEVVGVFEDFRQQPFEFDFEPTVLLSHAEVAAGLSPPESMTLLVRADGDRAGLAAAVRAAVRELDAAQPVGEWTSVAAMVRAATARRRLAAGLATAFSALATLLATLGVYGVVARATSARRRESAVRQALGATPRAIVRESLERAARWAVPGLLLGGVGAVLAGRAIAGQLAGGVSIGVEHLAAAILLLAGISGAAAWLPSRAVARVDPAEAFREN